MKYNSLPILPFQIARASDCMAFYHKIILFAMEI